MLCAIIDGVFVHLIHTRMAHQYMVLLFVYYHCVRCSSSTIQVFENFRFLSICFPVISEIYLGNLLSNSEDRHLILGPNIQSLK